MVHCLYECFIVEGVRHMLRLRIKELALNKGYIQTKFAPIVGVDQVTNKRYWHNTSDMVSLSILEKYARALETDVCSLFEAVEDSKK